MPMRSQRKRGGTEINETYQLLEYVGDVNRLGSNRYCNKHTETLTYASKEVGLFGNAEKLDIVFIASSYHCQTTGLLNMWHTSDNWNNSKYSKFDSRRN
jgi:hypothetical protein